MKRRQILKALVSAGAIPALEGQALATAFSCDQADLACHFQQAFRQALAQDARLTGFQSVERDFGRKELSIEGAIPKDLRGLFLRNGPAKHERGHQRLQHLFEADGMIQRFSIGEGKVLHEGRFVQTPKHLQEEQAQRFVYSGPDTHIANSHSVTQPDKVNTANTNIIAVGDKYWALWEAGSASQLDPESLQFEQFVDLGQGTAYGKRLKGLPFSAHPKIEKNGDIWNFGLLEGGQLAIYHLNAQGGLKNLGLLNSHYHGGMLHDFLITERHLLFILPSIETAAPGERGLFTNIRYNSKLPIRVLVVDKNSLSITRQFELDAGFAFHFGNAWDESDGSIHFDASVYHNCDIVAELSDVMRGVIRDQLSHSQTALVTLSPSGSADITRLGNSSEFPRVAAEQTGLKNRYLNFVASHERNFWNDTVAQLDLHTQQQSQYCYGSDYLVEEHIPINPSGREGAGYLIGTALHIPTQRTCLNIFHAQRLEDGPVARAWLPYHLPLGFHGNFVAS